MEPCCGALIAWLRRQPWLNSLPSPQRHRRPSRVSHNHARLSCWSHSAHPLLAHSVAGTGLWPIVWLISIPLRLVGIGVGAGLALIMAVLFLPAWVLCHREGSFTLSPFLHTPIQSLQCSHPRAHLSGWVAVGRPRSALCMAEWHLGITKFTRLGDMQSVTAILRCGLQIVTSVAKLLEGCNVDRVRCD